MGFNSGFKGLSERILKI